MLNVNLLLSLMSIDEEFNNMYFAEIIIQF